MVLFPNRADAFVTPAPLLTSVSAVDGAESAKGDQVRRTPGVAPVPRGSTSNSAGSHGCPADR
ncbi:hypothetical protein AW168_15615 [Nocardia brasiliensis]|nr:hypothetical protein AW168_15615 [Nocardia brasiliensis]